MKARDLVMPCYPFGRLLYLAAVPLALAGGLGFDSAAGATSPPAGSPGPAALVRGHLALTPGADAPRSPSRPPRLHDRAPRRRAAGVGGDHPAPAAAATAFELGCDTTTPDERLGIQQFYFGGDCLPGPPFSPGNLVGFAFPIDNDVQDGQITQIKVYFQTVLDPDPTCNLYIWEDGGGDPDDACGAERFKLIEAPIQGDSAFSVYNVAPAVPMDLGHRLWVGIVYPFTTFPDPTWYLGRIAGPSAPGRGFTNLTGDHSDWFDLDFFGWGQCFAVRLGLEPATVNLPPVADAGGPYCGTSTGPIEFDGTGSTDPNGDTITYQWEFGDGSTGSGPTPTHQYATGTAAYTVTLTVQDAASAADTASTIVGVDLPASVRVPADTDLETALSLAGPCGTDSILVAPGTYDGPFTLSGTDAVLLGTGGALATELRVLSAAAAVLSIVDGAPTVRGFQITGVRQGVVVTGPATVEDCRVVGCGRTGIVVSSSATATVTSCLVAGNSTDAAGGGVDLRGSHVLTRSTVDRNGVFGVRASPFLGSGTATIDRTIITNTESGPGIQCVASTPRVGCTDIWGNLLNLNCGDDLGNNFSADPLYCDPPSGDYNVHSDSPVLDVAGCGLVGFGGEGCGLSASIVSGTITDGQQTAISGLTVTASDVLAGVTIASDTTDVNGDYSLEQLPAGGYRIEVLPSGTFYLGEYYDDVQSYVPGSVDQAETIWLISPQAVTGIDFELAQGGTFSGQVTDAAGGGPLSSVAVVPFVFGGDTLRASETDIGGNYTSVPLPPGTYGAMTPGSSSYLGEYYQEAANPGDADPFSIAITADTPGISFTLDRLPIGVGPGTAPPTALTLGEPVPNPFNPSTTIPFALPGPSSIRLTIHDVRGRRVRTLIDDRLAAGHHRARWDGRATGGRRVASGIYLVSLEVRGNVLTRRLVLVR